MILPGRRTKGDLTAPLKMASFRNLAIFTYDRVPQELTIEEDELTYLVESGSDRIGD